MTKPLSFSLLLVWSLLSACTEEEKLDKDERTKATNPQMSLTKPAVALKSPDSGATHVFGMKNCHVYKGVQTQNEPEDWELLFKPAFYPLPKRCIVERLEMEGEYLQIEIGTQALGAGGCCTTYAAYRTQNGETWETRPATSIKEWQPLNNEQLDASLFRKLIHYFV